MPFLGRFGPQPRDAGCAATVGLAFGVPDAMAALVLQLVRGNRGELSPVLRLPRQKETQPCRGLAQTKHEMAPGPGEMGGRGLAAERRLQLMAAATAAGAIAVWLPRQVLVSAIWPR